MRQREVSPIQIPTLCLGLPNVREISPTQTMYSSNTCILWEKAVGIKYERSLMFLYSRKYNTIIYKAYYIGICSCLCSFPPPVNTQYIKSESVPMGTVCIGERGTQNATSLSLVEERDLHQKATSRNSHQKPHSSVSLRPPEGKRNGRINCPHVWSLSVSEIQYIPYIPFTTFFSRRIYIYTI